MRKKKGRVVKNLAHSLNTHGNQAILIKGTLSGIKHEQNARVYGLDGLSPTIHTQQGGQTNIKILDKPIIRRLTPRECFRAQDFHDSFKWDVSDSQAYKQAGNSIPIVFLELIIKELLKND